jgi:mono/diheme cytochrome c family protein
MPFKSVLPRAGARRLYCAALALALAPAVYGADSAAEQMTQWTAQARAAQPGFTPSAARGQAFYSRAFGVTPGLGSCAACHTPDPAAQGKHVSTGKTMAPLSPRANAQRFTDASRTEKWFRRNCKEVTGAECTAAEKADFVRFLQQGGV